MDWGALLLCDGVDKGWLGDTICRYTVQYYLMLARRWIGLVGMTNADVSDMIVTVFFSLFLSGMRLEKSRA